MWCHHLYPQLVTHGLKSLGKSIQILFFSPIHERQGIYLDRPKKIPRILAYSNGCSALPLLVFKLYPKIPTANIPKIPIKVSPFLLYGSTPLPDNPSPLQPLPLNNNLTTNSQNKTKTLRKPKPLKQTQKTEPKYRKLSPFYHQAKKHNEDPSFFPFNNKQ